MKTTCHQDPELAPTQLPLSLSSGASVRVRLVLPDGRQRELWVSSGTDVDPMLDVRKTAAGQPDVLVGLCRAAAKSGVKITELEMVSPTPSAP